MTRAHLNTWGNTKESVGWYDIGEERKRMTRNYIYKAGVPRCINADLAAADK